jgi:hypothetical protein
VSMTDVHGEPQQGGYLPAEIWHAYMSAVTEGKPCVPFPPAKESISYKPFYGKFASTGFTESVEEGGFGPSGAKKSEKGSGHKGKHSPSENESGGSHGNGNGNGNGGERKAAGPAPPARGVGPARPSPGTGTAVKRTGGASPG